MPPEPDETRGRNPGGGASRRTSGWATGRVEAFSDGVLAIAITLLVLEIRLPAHVEGDLPRALRDLWPSYVAYLASFVIIGIMWAQHHGLFRLIERGDQGLLVVNVLLLAGISFLPFPTSVVAETLKAGGSRSDLTAALLLYGGTLVVIAVLYNLLWHYARLRGLLARDLDPGVVRALTRSYVAGPVLYLVALLLAPVSATAAYAMWIGLAVYFLRGVPASPPDGG